MSLIVHAPNVHQGGGRALLSVLLETMSAGGGATAFLDDRMQLEASAAEGLRVLRVAPTVTGRVTAEWRLRTVATRDDIVLSFGNLPPLFPTAARVALFLQNRYLVGARDLGQFPFSVRARIRAERAWLRARLPAVSQVIVQSRSMASEVEREFRRTAIVAPFAATRIVERWRAPAPARATGTGPIDFVYVSSGDPHKNHETLFAAWELLAHDGLRPSLCVTLDEGRYPTLCEEIQRARARAGVDIVNVGVVAETAVHELYGRSTALIFPSLFESFGLPLLEARAAGLAVLAPERDYVRDIVDPEETFEPESPLSIARAVRRFLGRAETPTLLSATEFVDRLRAGEF